jgi:hypothetical protein
MFVANALIKCLTQFHQHLMFQRRSFVCISARGIEYSRALCGKLCVGIRAAQDTVAARYAYRLRALPRMARQPTQSWMKWVRQLRMRWQRTHASTLRCEAWGRREPVEKN